MTHTVRNEFLRTRLVSNKSLKDKIYRLHLAYEFLKQNAWDHFKYLDLKNLYFIVRKQIKAVIAKLWASQDELPNLLPRMTN